MESRIQALESEFEAEADNLRKHIEDDNARATAASESRRRIARQRGAPS